MENKNKKCSSKNHKEIDAKVYCQECKVYMCDSCENFHSNLCQKHHIFNLNDSMNELLNEFCTEKNHSYKLEYFCKDHNQLCCLACISSLKDKTNGQHNSCDVCTVEKIENNKKNILKESIQYLSYVSNSVDELKKTFKKINENKDILKVKIQKVFKMIRDTLNDREFEILSEVDEQFDNLYFQEDIIRESIKLSDKIKATLKISKLIEKEWNNNSNINKDKIISLINNCINIEYSIRDINIINEKLKQYGPICKLKIRFTPDGYQINKFLEIIKTFGKIYYNKFALKKCPSNLNSQKKFEIMGETNNIMTKVGGNDWVGTICEYELENGKEHIWRIRILNSTQYKNILVGVAPLDFSSETSTYSEYGWYFNIYNSKLYSGPPFNYYGKVTNLKKAKNEIILIMDMNERSLKFIIDGEDKGESYKDIPLDKPIAPAIFLYDKEDTVEILEY